MPAKSEKHPSAEQVAAKSPRRGAARRCAAALRPRFAQVLQLNVRSRPTHARAPASLTSKTPLSPRPGLRGKTRDKACAGIRQGFVAHLRCKMVHQEMARDLKSLQYFRIRRGAFA